VGIGINFVLSGTNQPGDMKYIYRLTFLVLFALTMAIQTSAQPINTVKVAVFTPMYLEDAFTGNTYKLGKSNLPKNILPGLEFYNGVMMAVDSLNKEGIKAEIAIYDSRQDAASLDRVMKGPELANIGLMIAAITNTTELKLFADQALLRNVPLVSATYPNYVGIRQNPFFVLLNSSFNAHLEGLYKYMQRNLSLNEIVAIKRPGSTEDYIQRTINELNKATPSLALKIKWLQLKDDFSASELQPYLDSTRNNTFFVASPAEAFGEKVVKALGNYESYNATVVGMPTWDGIKQFNRHENKNVEIIYSTPFNYSQNESLYSHIRKDYKDNFSSRPSDMVFKGFETVYHFTRLLAKHGNNLVNNLSDKEFTVFNNFDIQPVKLKRSNPKPDFLENKKLYFVKKREGYVLSIY
jgi:hypothetical protein